jgi:nitrogen fixation NifU-like protein
MTGPRTDDPRDIILDHHQHPRNHRTVSTPSVAQRGSNPLCGDEVELSLEIDADSERIVDIGCISRGCSIVRASASLMTEVLRGRSLAEATHTARGVLSMGPAPAGLREQLAALREVQMLYPARVKCARLPWATLTDAVDRYAKALLSSG